MKVEFLDPATAEFLEAITYFNGQTDGLGYEFAAEVKQALVRVVQHPAAWTPLSQRTRRCLINRFPFGVIYQIRQDTILIVAVMDLRRHPDSWRTRLPPSQR